MKSSLAIFLIRFHKKNINCMKRHSIFQLKHSRRIVHPLWGYRSLRQDRILSLLLRKSEKTMHSDGPSKKGLSSSTVSILSYSTLLRYKRMISLFYGNITEKTYKKIIQNSKKYNGILGVNILTLLEKRLDSILFRSGFVHSILEARQFIRHGHVSVNGSITKISSFSLKSGDIYKIHNKKLELNLLRKEDLHQEKKTLTKNIVKIHDWKPQHLEINYNIKTGIFLFTPQELAYPTFFSIQTLSDIARLNK